MTNAQKTEPVKELVNNNLEVWDFLGKTDPNFTKPITGKRFNGTSINATYCYRKLTERFGLCGVGWKYEVTKRTVHDAPEGQLLLFVDVALYIRVQPNVGSPVWSDPIPGVGGNTILAAEGQGEKRKIFVDDEAYKKATTDALTNAMKFLGMSADIHTGLYDDNKYQAELRQEFGSSKLPDKAPENKPAPAPEPAKVPPNPLFSTPEEIAAWPTATLEKVTEMAKLASGRRATWLKTADAEVKVLINPEAVTRWKETHKGHIAALGTKQKEWLDQQIAARLTQVSQAPPPTQVDALEDEIPF